MAHDLSYPSLYIAADDYSGHSQRWYFRLLILEYVVLVSTAIIALFGFQGTAASAAYASAFALLLIITSVTHFARYDERWYRSRAIAESVKTTTWRYMMKSEPFTDRPSILVAQAEFRNFLSSTTEYHRDVVKNFDPKTCEGPSISDEMNAVRLLSWPERLSLYIEQRVKSQRSWYAKKSKYNRSAGLFWYIVTCLIYSFSFILIAADVISIDDGWPLVSVFLLLGSGVLGFIKAKRFGELASSYQLTAREIGRVLGKQEEVKDDISLSEYVNESERAFSREHTQWVARQD